MSLTLLYVLWSIVATVAALHYRGRALRAETRSSISIAKREWKAVPDPGKQALEMLRRGENCDWYSVKHSDEQHEAFDCLEIYWRTNVEHPERNELRWGRGPFEPKAGFRVRWRVAATRHSCVEACGMDLLTTILDAREQVDRIVERNRLVDSVGGKHPTLEVWRSKSPEREYDFDGLDLESWRVSLRYPGGNAWSRHADLDQAVTDALSKAPQ